MGVSVSFSAAESSYSVANNTSTIKCTLKVTTTGESHNYNGMKFKITIGDYSDSKTIAVGYNTSKSFSFSKTITHKADGTLSVACKGTVTTGISAGTVTKSKTLSTSGGTLTTIPRASAISSATNITLGSACSIKWTPLSSSFNYKLKFTLGDWSYTTGSISPKTTSAYTYTGYTIPIETLLPKIPGATGTVTATLTTYNGTTQIGSSNSKTFTVTVPDSYTNSSGQTVSLKPTIGNISVSFTEISHVNGKRSDLLIKGKNKVVVNVSECTSATGATITSYTFSGQDLSTTVNSASASLSATSNVMTKAGIFSYTVTIKDSRGKTASKTVSNIDCRDYITPSITNFKANRYIKNTDGTYTQNNDGGYIGYSYSANYTSIKKDNVETNGANVNVYYKTTTDTKIFTIDSVSSPGYFEIPAGNESSTFQVWVGINDYYYGAGISTDSFITCDPVTVLSPSRIINIRPDGMGVALGKKSEKEGFECAWDATFYRTASGPSGFSTSSDRKVKKNIENLEIDIIDKLQSVQYQLINPIDDKVHYGFVAQDVIQALSESGIDPETCGIVGTVQNGKEQQYVLTYTEFVPLLVNKCQNLQSEVTQLHQEIAEIKKLIT